MSDETEFSLAQARSLVTEHIARVTPEQWTQLLVIAREALDGEPGEWGGGMKTEADGRVVMTMPYFHTSKALSLLVTTLYQLELIVPFAWMAWGKSRPNAAEMAEDDDATAVMHLTTSVRRDRFVEGGLAHDVKDKTWSKCFAVLERTHGG